MMIIYMGLWVSSLVFLSYEYWALNFQTQKSILMLLQSRGILGESFIVSAIPGKSLSMWLGWTGLGLMVLMNVYTLRKKMGSLKSLGKLSGWLNFHVFCGLVGPTLIMFHCNFKVRGLVAISFWSMVISLSSGIIGRYFYVQMVSKKVEFENLAERCAKRLDRILEKFKVTPNPALRDQLMVRAQLMAGVPSSFQSVNPFSAFFLAMAGDLRLSFQRPEVGPGWPVLTKELLKHYAVNKRRALFLESFQKLMGYWHAFHFPFAVFMYIAAVIHVISSQIFRG